MLLANLKSDDLVAWKDEPGDILRFGEVLEEDTVAGKVTVSSSTSYAQVIASVLLPRRDGSRPPG
jgi:hypothetical protein